MTVLIGVDVGSSGCKVAAVNERGRLLYSSRTYPYPTRYPQPGWAEQDPEAWYRAACLAIRECVERGSFAAAEIHGVAVDGPAHNVALLDEDDNVLYPTLHWSDLRSAPQARRLEADLGERIYAITHQRVNPSWTLSQLLWLKENEPSVWSRLRRLLVTKDYVRYRLAGRYATDIYDATGTQLYDVARNAWSGELCQVLQLAPDRLPPVGRAWDAGGTVTPAAARETGLPVGLPVAMGSGDSVVEAAGIGSVAPGQCVVKLGTAANVNLVTAVARPSLHSLTYPHLVDDHWFTIAATNSGTATMRWFRETFLPEKIPGATTAIGGAYKEIDRLAATAAPGSEGLLFHPYLMGERSPYWDPHLRGDFIGISARHSLAHFTRAMLEGVAFSIRDCMDAVESLGEPIVERRLLGGGARSPVWRQLLCDVLGRPLVKPAIESAAFGGALLAGIATGVFANWQEAIATCVQIEQVLEPDPAAHEIYCAYFETYRAITSDLARHHHRLVDLGSGTEAR